MKFGKLPPDQSDTDLQNEHGPNWTWFMIRLLAQSEEDNMKALCCNSVQERLLLVQEYIEKTKQTMNVQS